MKICAGIVLFNPEIERLNENIEHIRKQVPMLILVDNGSSNLEDVKSLICDVPNIILLENGKNLGIAQALNRIFLDFYLHSLFLIFFHLVYKTQHLDLHHLKYLH